MSLRFFYARAECGEVCMGRLGLVGRLGLMDRKRIWFESRLLVRRGREPRAERSSKTPHSHFPLPLCVPCVSVFTPLCLPNKKIAQANRLRWLTCAT